MYCLFDFACQSLQALYNRYFVPLVNITWYVFVLCANLNPVIFYLFITVCLYVELLHHCHRLREDWELTRIYHPGSSLCVCIELEVYNTAGVIGCWLSYLVFAYCFGLNQTGFFFFFFINSGYSKARLY